MLHLITYRADFGSISNSPFCIKAVWMLNASGQPWQREDASDPRKMPYGKLPALRTPHGLIADSHNIQTYLEQHGADFQAGLSAIDKAHSTALIRMAEDHMYFHIVMDRWANDAVWPILRDAYFSNIPALIRRPATNKVRKSVMHGLHTQGIARFTVAERRARLEPDLQTIATLVADKPFLCGTAPTLADYSVAAMLCAMRENPVETPLSQRVQSDTVLSGYATRVSDAMMGV